eukprot:902580-Amphidinium_carterae.2
MYCCPPGDVRTTSALCNGGATSDGLGATGTHRALGDVAQSVESDSNVGHAIQMGRLQSDI